MDAVYQSGGNFSGLVLFPRSQVSYLVNRLSREERTDSAMSQLVRLGINHIFRAAKRSSNHTRKMDQIVPHGGAFLHL